MLLSSYLIITFQQVVWAIILPLPDPVKMGKAVRDGVEERAKLPTSAQQKFCQGDEGILGEKGEASDDFETMEELAIAASEQVQKLPFLLQQYHPKTGKIRSPREYPDSDSG